MANTYKLISSVTVGSDGPSTINFTSIPTTYTDLVIKLSARSTIADGDLKINFNSVTTGYSRFVLQGSGSYVIGGSTVSDSWIGVIPGTGQNANIFSNTEIYISNYAGSNYKSFSVDNVFENNGMTAYTNLISRLWSNTNAITSISLSALSGSLTFAQHSTAYLYGISNA